MQGKVYCFNANVVRYTEALDSLLGGTQQSANISIEAYIRALKVELKDVFVGQNFELKDSAFSSWRNCCLSCKYILKEEHYKYCPYCGDKL